MMILILQQRYKMIRYSFCPMHSSNHTMPYKCCTLLIAVLTIVCFSRAGTIALSSWILLIKWKRVISTQTSKINTCTHQRAPQNLQTKRGKKKKKKERKLDLKQCIHEQTHLQSKPPIVKCLQWISGIVNTRVSRKQIVNMLWVRKKEDKKLKIRKEKVFKKLVFRLHRRWQDAGISPPKRFFGHTCGLFQLSWTAFS